MVALPIHMPALCVCSPVTKEMKLCTTGLKHTRLDEHVWKRERRRNDR